MLEKSFGLLFFLKQPKKQTIDVRYIYLRITVDGVSKELSTKRLWDRNRWNQASGRATGSKEDARTLNAYLDVLSNTVFQAKKKLVEANRTVTAEALKNSVLGIGEEKRMVLEIFQRHNDQMEKLVGNEFAPGTLQRYKTSYSHTRSFIKWKYNSDDLDINDLDYEFVAEYAFWLKSIRKCGHNSTVKYISNFKKIIISCIKRGWLQKDPFVDFSTAKKEVVRTALTKDELATIAAKSFSIDRLAQVRDIFLFSCYTGLAYIDVQNLRRSQIIKGIDGEQWLITNRQKTDSPTRLPLLPLALDILTKYDHHPKCKDEGFVLPVLSNQKMNSYLKEIADGCGISKNLTFHIARHTFATTVTLSNGVPLETVSKMLGHNSIKQTQHYAKIVDLKVSEDMANLKQKLSI